MKKTVVLYVCGKGGNAAEAEHYRALFPDAEVCGFDYKSNTPWDAANEFPAFFAKLKAQYSHIVLIANSIGAYFCMNSGVDEYTDRAFFISPIVNMERLIADMMTRANLTEERLKAERIIKTEFGEDLSWDYLCYVRENPIKWDVPTAILRGSTDNLQSAETIRSFADAHNASLTVLDGGEHWFHTPEQMQFLDDWIRKPLRH